MNDTIHALQQLGFTEYEARAYQALVDAGELNGYALAKASGIPRANIYAVAEKLVQRGAAERLRHGERLSYLPVAPTRLLRGIETDQKQTLAAARQALARRAGDRRSTAVASLRGDELLIRARQLVDAASERLLIALQPAEATQLAQPLRSARERGVNITTLCLDACERECGGCQGEIHRYQLVPRGDQRWLVLVADRCTALVGQIGDTSAEGVTTGQPLLVELAGAYIRQSVALAMLGDELAGRFDGLLSQQTRQCLDRLNPDGGFLAFIQSLSATASS